MGGNSTIHSEFYKELFENNIEDQDTELYKFLLYPLINNISRQNMKKVPKIITKSEALAPEEIDVKKHRRYTYYLSAATGETGLTGETRASVTPEKHVPKKKGKYSYLCLH